MSNYLVRTRLIFALLGALLASFVVPAQQEPDARVRLNCSFRYAPPIKKVLPKYPPLAQQLRISGRVSMKCLIGRDGSVKEIQVKKGHPLFIQAVTDAVSQWKYKPLLLNGQAVETETVINIDFQLLEEKKQPESTR